MRTLLAATAAAVALAAVWATTAPAATTAVSSNWAGYAVTGSTYSKVTGTWVQPTASCTSVSSTTASAFWVGLGGDSTSSTALEQVGTEADCNGDGTVSYSAWYELVPDAAVKVPLAVSPGNTISATVVVEATKVTVQIRNVTTGASFRKTLTMSNPDTSSAEWIAEAPSVETRFGMETLPLTDFGTVKFTNAVATSTAGVTSSVSSARRQVEKLTLVSTSSGDGRFAAFTAPATAVPSALGSGGKSFSVTWKQLSSSAAGGPPGRFF